MTDERLLEMIKYFEELLKRTEKDETEESWAFKKTTIDGWAIQSVLWQLNKEKEKREFYESICLQRN